MKAIKDCEWEVLISGSKKDGFKWAAYLEVDDYDQIGIKGNSVIRQSHEKFDNKNSCIKNWKDFAQLNEWKIWNYKY